MKNPPSEPLRGQAAYRAHLKSVAHSNEVAQAAAMRRRTEGDAAKVNDAAKRARDELRDLHRQTGH